MAGRAGRRSPLDLDLIWNGDGRNENAALTIFRHFDSASVVKGMVGEPPKTAWVIGYPLLERIHYLLVADFDVYGNVGHQLNTRLYMDFMRMEGEFNFLALLPKSQRIATRDFWYRGTGEAGREQVYGGPGTTLDVESKIVYRSGDAKNELLALMKARLAPVLNTSFDLSTVPDPALRARLQALQDVGAASLRWLPEAAVLGVATADGTTATFTLLRNTGHASVVPLGRGIRATPGRGHLDRRARGDRRLSERLLSSPSRGIAGLRRSAASTPLRRRLLEVRPTLGRASQRRDVLGVQRRSPWTLCPRPDPGRRRARLQPTREPLNAPRKFDEYCRRDVFSRGSDLPMIAAADSDATLLPADISLLSGAISGQDPRAAALAAIEQIASARMQVTVFSASVCFLDTLELERVYSSLPGAYAVGARKSKRETSWARQVMQRRQVFVGEGPLEMAAAFDDQERMAKLGIRSLINVPFALRDGGLGVLAFGRPLERVSPAEITLARLLGLAASAGFALGHADG